MRYDKLKPDFSCTTAWHGGEFLLHYSYGDEFSRLSGSIFWRRTKGPRFWLYLVPALETT